MTRQFWAPSQHPTLITQQLRHSRGLRTHHIIGYKCGLSKKLCDGLSPPLAALTVSQLSKKSVYMAVDTTPTAPQPSALTYCLKSHGLDGAHSPHYQNLAFQILHNLQYQHDWTSLRIHTHSSLTQKALPRPLISGLPPHRIYVHPDDQVEELKSGADPTKREPEREWVLPTHLAEKWSLRRFGEVFDAIEEEPLGEQSGMSQDEDVERKTMAKKRRGGKRLLLATLGDDSTVVYYVVHDGLVKPRQN